MTVYANIVNNEIKGVYDLLPAKWNGHENFNVTCSADQDFMKNNGFVKINKRQYEYNPLTHRLSDFPTYRLENGEVIEDREILEIPEITDSISNSPENENLIMIRQLRNEKMRQFEWRYNRYMRQTRLGIETTDNLVDLDNYMQALADITKQYDLNNIVWPTF